MARPLRTAFGSLAVAALVLAGCNGDDGGDDGIVDDNGVIEDNGDDGVLDDGGDAEPEFDRDVDDDRDSGNGAADGIENPLDDD